MTETEVAELASNKTEVAEADDDATTSADCVVAGEEDNEISKAGTDNETTSTAVGGSNETAVANAPESDEEILVIEGQDFAPGQVVL